MLTCTSKIAFNASNSSSCRDIAMSFCGRSLVVYVKLNRYSHNALSTVDSTVTTSEPLMQRFALPYSVTLIISDGFLLFKTCCRSHYDLENILTVEIHLYIL